MYNSDSLSGALLWLAFFFVLIGAFTAGFCFWLIPWLWDLAKPWLHAITA